MNSSHNNDTTAVRGGASAVATPANSGASLFGSLSGARTGNGDSAPRRPSDDQKFANLHAVKRGSGDATAQARRESLQDQKPKPGVVGQMWDSLTKGR